MLQYLFLNVETTGLKEDSLELVENSQNNNTSKIIKGDEVIQIGGILTNDSLEPKLTFCHFCDTSVPLSQEAYEIHGISLEYLRTYNKDIYLKEVIKECLPFLYDSDLITIGYNIMFDITMINQTLRDFKNKPEFGDFFKLSFIPKNGKYLLDLMPFYMKKEGLKSYRQSLKTITKGLEKEFYAFFKEYPDVFLQSDNSDFMNRPLDASNHNSFAHSLYCYLLFKRDIWKTKLI